MIKKCVYALVLLLWGHSISAQTGFIVTGQVVEKDSYEPLIYANIVLSRQSDSSLAAGVATDSYGNFKFENVQKGKYFISASFIGFEKIETPVFELNSNIYVGKLAIKKSSILLDAVNVAGEKSSLQSNLDKKVYNVGKDVISESGSVTDILQNIPSVSADVNGNISIRGTSKITYLINGKSSARLRRNATIALQQIPAYTIERIEVITNPSAKYSPEGTGGIINIIQRKDADIGFNGQVIGNIGNEKRYNSSLVLSRGHDNLNAILSYSLRHPSGTNIFSDERIENLLTNGVSNTRYIEEGSSLTKPLGHVFDAGVVYRFDENNLFEFTGNYFSQNSFHEGNSNINITNNQGHLIESFRTLSTNDEYEKEGEGGISFEHLFNGNEDHSLVLEAAYGGYDEEEDQLFNEIYTIPTPKNSIKKILVNKRGSQVELVAEYAVPINEESDFEAGYTGEFIYDNIYYNTENSPNRFIIDQNNQAFYALYNRDMEPYSLELGLRSEVFGITSHLAEPVDSLIERNYFKLYPTLRLSYEINKFQNLSFSYSRRVNRPEADQLNPYPE